MKQAVERISGPWLTEGKGRAKPRVVVDVMCLENVRSRPDPDVLVAIEGDPDVGTRRKQPNP